MSVKLMTRKDQWVFSANLLTPYKAPERAVVDPFLLDVQQNLVALATREDATALVQKLMRRDADKYPILLKNNGDYRRLCIYNATGEVVLFVMAPIDRDAECGICKWPLQSPHFSYGVYDFPVADPLAIMDLLYFLVRERAR